MDFFSPQAVTGLNPGAGPSTATTAGGPPPASGASAGPSGQSQTPLYSPGHPLFWAGVLIATTYGLIGLNSAFHIGPFKASVGIK